MSSLPTPPRTLNPLWLIFLFFTFTEVVLGVSAYRAQAGVQVALTVFVIAFPVLVSSAFFAILWFRPTHFYAPRDYTDDQTFLQGMRDAQQRQELGTALDERIEREVTKALLSETTIAKLSTANKSDVREVLAATAKAATSVIEKATLFAVDLSPFGITPSPLRLAIDSYATIDQLANDIYFSLRGQVPAFSYGNKWIMRDVATGRAIETARMKAGTPEGTSIPDRRTLQQVGIVPGVSLRVERVE